MLPNLRRIALGHSLRDAASVGMNTDSGTAPRSTVQPSDQSDARTAEATRALKDMQSIADSNPATDARAAAATGTVAIISSWLGNLESALKEAEHAWSGMVSADQVVILSERAELVRTRAANVRKCAGRMEKALVSLERAVKAGGNEEFHKLLQDVRTTVDTGLTKETEPTTKSNWPINHFLFTWIRSVNKSLHDAKKQGMGSSYRGLTLDLKSEIDALLEQLQHLGSDVRDVAQATTAAIGRSD